MQKAFSAYLQNPLYGPGAAILKAFAFGEHRFKNPDKLIVHRVIRRYNSSSFLQKGDSITTAEIISYKHVIGLVIAIRKRNKIIYLISQYFSWGLRLCQTSFPSTFITYPKLLSPHSPCMLQLLLQGELGLQKNLQFLLPAHRQ